MTSSNRRAPTSSPSRCIALGQFWPRAESRLYGEPKKLVAHGLASATEDRVGRHPRTVYAIIPAGRRALAEWIRTPGTGPQLELEELIKVFFAEHGTRDDLLATIGRVHDWVDDTVAGWTEIAPAYLHGKGPFPQRLPWLILTGRLLDEHVQAGRLGRRGRRRLARGPQPSRTRRADTAEYRRPRRRPPPEDRTAPPPAGERHRARGHPRLAHTSVGIRSSHRVEASRRVHR
jgi:hypothetical protein